MSDVIIEIKNVSKTFYLREDRKSSLKSLVASFFKQGRTKKFKALDSINLDIKKGEFIGIVGRNGSGKSTLLKLIAGIYTPDKGGSIKLNGSLIPFLELGVGFNPELTGRENVYLNGTILGMSTSFLNTRYEEIVKFAELEEFMETPVKNYSSGMLVRLAFSIAIQASADIYILDEILAVGDENFQRKSISVINRLKQEGKTILYVSHAMDTVERFADRAILIHESRLAVDNKPSSVIDHYRKLNSDEANARNQQVQIDPSKPNRWGNRDIEILGVDITDLEGNKKSLYTNENRVVLHIRYKVNKMNSNVSFGVGIYRSDGLHVTGTNTNIHRYQPEIKQKGVINYAIDPGFLLDGQYFVSVAAINNDTDEALDYHSQMYDFEIRSYKKDHGIVSLPCEWSE